MIEPALSADEWEVPHAPRPHLYACVERETLTLADGTVAPLTGICLDAVEEPQSIYALIALANAALPDSDPRKLRRDWLCELRDAADEIEMQLRNPHWRMADDRSLAAHRMHTLRLVANAIESYLPPP